MCTLRVFLRSAHQAHLVSAQNDHPQEHSLGAFAGVLILSTHRSAQLEHSEALNKSAHMSAQQDHPQSTHWEHSTGVPNFSAQQGGVPENFSAQHECFVEHSARFFRMHVLKCTFAYGRFGRWRWKLRLQLFKYFGRSVKGLLREAFWRKVASVQVFFRKHDSFP